jgi:glycosyltransferase involved in cell wall biosynthesis
MMKKRPIRVGIFDQIVSGGGVRLFTTKLLEEFSRAAGSEWLFHLMWPLFDSSNNFLPAPTLPAVSFERIRISRRSRFHRAVVPALNRIGANNLLPQKPRRRIKDYERVLIENEQRIFRLGNGRGLEWLDERADDFDLLYIPYPYLTLSGNGALWRPTKPLVITLHDLAHEFTDAWGDVGQLLRHEVQQWTQISDLVIFSSDYVMSEAMRIYHLPPERARRIYLSPHERVTTSRRQHSDILRYYGLTQGYVFTLGWAAKHKGTDTLLNGFALFKKKTGGRMPLVFAGPSTENLRKSELHGLEIGKDVFALGYVPDEDIPALYQNSSLVVTASTSEAGFNTMIFDAMNYEKPILCSNIPPFVERLGTDDRISILFDPNSPESLCDALLKHFGDPERAKLRAQEAKRFIAERTLTDVGRDYLEAFKLVLENCTDVEAGKTL